MEAYDLINAWNYFTLNYGDPEEILITVFGEHLGKHFYGKFDAFYDRCRGEGAWINLWAEMTSDNRKKLLEWVMNNFSMFRK